jgi:hypothetical protein
MGNVNPRGMFHKDTSYEVVADRIIGTLGGQHHLDASVHTAALARRLAPLVRHKAWDINDDGKWTRALLTHVLAHFGLTLGHVAKGDRSLGVVSWEMLDAACAAVELQLAQAQ